MGGGQKMGHSARRELFQSQLSLENVFNRRRAGQEVLRKYSGTGKRILLKKYRKLWPKVKSGRRVHEQFFQVESPFLNFWSQILIWHRPYASGPSVVTSS
jgi:hypothetical protein